MAELVGPAAYEPQVILRVARASTFLYADAEGRAECGMLERNAACRRLETATSGGGREMVRVEALDGAALQPGPAPYCSRAASNRPRAATACALGGRAAISIVTPRVRVPSLAGCHPLRMPSPGGARLLSAA